MTRYSYLGSLGVLCAVLGCGDSTGTGGTGGSTSTNNNGGNGGTPSQGGDNNGGTPSVGGNGGAPLGGGDVGGAGGGTFLECSFEKGCDPKLVDECLCSGCGDGTVCDENVDCVCTQCAGNKLCGADLCEDDGLCDPYLEGCGCEDCATHPLCEKV